MLVLSRKKSQAIVIDGGIRITVMRIRDGAVRLGIDAPKDVRVDREEALNARREAELACFDPISLGM